MESFQDITLKAAPQKAFIIDAHTHILPLQGGGWLQFASDTTCIDPRYELGKITLSPVSDEIKQKILAGNFLRLLQGSQMGKIETE